MKKIILALAMCLASFDANAFLIDPYVGLDYGYSSYNLSKKYKEFDKDDFGTYGAVVGVKLLSMVSAEAFYNQSEHKNNSVISNNNVSNKLKLKSYGVDVVGDVLNLGLVEVLSSVGYGYYKADMNNKVSGIKYKTDEDGNGIRLGLGAQFNPTPSIGIRGMFRYTFTNVDEVKNMKEFTLGLRYYF